MAFIALYDASVLYPASLRDLLVRLAQTRLFRARFTATILEEWIGALLRHQPSLDPQRLQRTRKLMIDAVPDCIVEGYENLVTSLELPDADDRHVLAAAIRAGAQVIVTSNLKDFPDGVLVRYDIEAQHPDVFVAHLIDLEPATVVEVVRQQAADLRRPPMAPAQVIDRLEQLGLVQTAAVLRELIV